MKSSCLHIRFELGPGGAEGLYLRRTVFALHLAVGYGLNERSGYGLNERAPVRVLTHPRAILARKIRM